MANNVELNKRVLQAYPELGTDINGIWIGKVPFKARCIHRFRSNESKDHIRQSVNWLIKCNKVPYLINNFVAPAPPTVPFERWVAASLDGQLGTLSQPATKKQIKSLVDKLQVEVPRCYTALEMARLELVVQKIVKQLGQQPSLQPPPPPPPPPRPIPTAPAATRQPARTVPTQPAAAAAGSSAYAQPGYGNANSSSSQWTPNPQKPPFQPTRRIPTRSAAPAVPPPPPPPPPAPIPIPTEPIIPPRNPRIEELNAAAQGSAYQNNNHESFDDDDDDDDDDQIPTLESQRCLLKKSEASSNQTRDAVDNLDIERAVLFTSDVLHRTGGRQLLPQFALLGAMIDTGSGDLWMQSNNDNENSNNGINNNKNDSRNDHRLFLNTNHPCSFFICGLQGSGKSYTTSALLENFLIRTRTLGPLRHPLSALVFNYSAFTTRHSFRPCEAAFLAFPAPLFARIPPVTVTVLVSPSNLLNLRAAYTQIPGVSVRALRIPPASLTIGSILTLMAVDTSGSGGSAPPLYLAHVTRVLRELAAVSPTLDFAAFKSRLGALDLSPMQRRPLELRLELLESFLDLGSGDDHDRPWLAGDAGAMTIVDLSCPFVDENTACVLFEICLGVFLGGAEATGKVVALDEAHKYITNTTPGSKSLTAALLSTIRQQRHYGARIIISTQEPTIDPRLLDLSSVTLIHRFTSPDWFATLRRHLPAASGGGGGSSGGNDGYDNQEDLFRRIVDLRVGQALVFAPGAICCGEKLNSRLLALQVRNRVTWDGGKSILSAASTKPLKPKKPTTADADDRRNAKLLELMKEPKVNGSGSGGWDLAPSETDDTNGW